MIHSPENENLVIDNFNIKRTQSPTNYVASDRKRSIKINAVIRNLDSEILQYVSDVVRFPCNNDKFKYIKQNIIKWLLDTRRKQVSKHLNDIELADRKPT